MVPPYLATPHSTPMHCQVPVLNQQMHNLLAHLLQPTPANNLKRLVTAALRLTTAVHRVHFTPAKPASYTPVQSMQEPHVRGKSCSHAFPFYCPHS